MLENLRLETLVGLGAASLLGYVLWGPKTTKTRAANAAGALAGLQNIGNSCFLNAVLQALASSPAVIRWLSGPPSDSASPAHRQLRAALIDVIQVVNRTHPEQRADPFTPAGVVACLLRLGWLIRRDEQDTHEMFYVLMSTLQEEPPPLAFSADGLRAGDGPVEADTGEPLVDWSDICTRLRGDARDICGAGVSGGVGTKRRSFGAGKRGDVAGVVGQNGDVGSKGDVRDGAESYKQIKDSSVPVYDNGGGSDTQENGSAARENGDASSGRAGGDDRATSHPVDGRGDRAEDSNSAENSTCAGPPQLRSSPTNCQGTAPSAPTSSQFKAVSPPETVSQSEPARSSRPATAADSPPAVNGPPAIDSPPAAVTGPVSNASPVSNSNASPVSYASPMSNIYASPMSNSNTSPPSNTSPVSNSNASPLSNASPVSNSNASPVPNPGPVRPAGGVVGRRRLRSIVHRVHAAGAPGWRSAAGPLRSPFTGTVSTQLVCQTCRHKCAVRWENFESLSLPLPAAPRPQALSLPALLGQFSAHETVQDVACDACRRRGRFSKRTLVAKLPSSLCIHLPRTTWQDNGQAGKRGDHVSFFETLNMFPYTYTANVTTGTPGRPVSPPLDSGRHTYRLTAVIVHSGGASSGHFVTYRRQPDPADGRWFYTSDTVVSLASASEVFSSAAYMLFYDRVTPAAAVAGAGAASPMAAALLSPVTPALLSAGPSSPLLRPPAREQR